MAESDERDVRMRWLREPPGVGEVRVLVECGDGAELSAEARQALERLMNELNEAEVRGYRVPGSIGPTIGIFGAPMKVEGHCSKLVCGTHDCGQHSCDTYSSKFV